MTNVITPATRYLLVRSMGRTNSFNPAPKVLRVYDSKITQLARNRDGYCLYGLLHKDGCSDGLDGHHIKTRGSGGDDVLENIISLCRMHHDMAGAYKIEPEELLSILTLFHGYVYENINPWSAKDWIDGRSTAIHRNGSLGTVSG